MTVSAKGDRYTNRYQKYSVFDTVISNEDLKRNILIFSEALVHLVYSFHDTSINYFIDNNALITDSYIDQIKSFLIKNPRAPHMI